MDELYQRLAERIEQTNKQYDMERIERAYQLAKRAHEGTLRRSGEPYIVHPVCAAIILVELGMDTDSIVAALLHDVVEDTEITLEEIRKEFGKDVAFLVDGVTKLGRIPFSSREHQQAENVRKMLLAMAQDVRVIIIKLADRLHNARTFESLPDEKRRIKALETMEVYAPLAHRLGIRGVKEELEDISLKYLDPIAYADIESQLALRKEERQAFLQRIIVRINKRLEEEHVKAQIDGRVKSIYGIYRKVYMQGRNMDEIYDVYAVRVIVDTVLECYNILGIIHDMLQPIPNRFKDYISTPKQNMYQSLHTTVIDKEGIPFEVQIRTWDMHYTAEYGVAAHWKYKVGLEGKDSLEVRLSWIRQILESQKESDDVEDLVKSIKTDIAPEEVFVFTPKGDVITLPVDSTVIDFAYAIHSAVGNRMIGAKVDGRMVSLDFKVKTGMIVEVLTASGRGSGPSRDWLSIVRTSEARNKIRSWFKKERREENIQEGRAALDKEFRRNLISLSDSDKETFLADIAARQRYNSVDDFFAAIGYGGLSLQKLIPRIREEFQKQYRTPVPDTPQLGKIPPRLQPAKASSGVIVEGLDGCLVKFARCCNPVPGDDIVGFITRGFGVSIHKKDCTNVVNADLSSDRWVRTEWASTVKETFKSTIDIIGSDRQGLLADVSVTLSNMRVPIHTFMARETKDNHSHIQVTIGISDLEQLRSIMSSLRKISGVVSVQRSNQPTV
ncbi:MAG: bifunctional (p)ppGpp synthetase/guanosine-3',5'-bis(diphosphate) 3'-pyrophosphohydrolase [Angelakisella sp.]|nr:bifunctional (p)ppGpp synthetase/guanosine-3',5'-bis(diphosphate) 3'-pyrophosphohydrolase [Angelakisella sp.]MCI9665987.1 bifunctional (p)ppGpp synthetase/guanosine-3',5'-bis(diphosphate) 3'-pyrophosphohydrolase [Angelakisella sp.]